MIHRTLLISGMALFFAGCANYYQVKDPTTNKCYYTRMIWDKPSGVAFDDVVTGKSVTLQNSEVARITRDQYNAMKRLGINAHHDNDWPEARPAGGTIGPNRQIDAPYQRSLERGTWENGQYRYDSRLGTPDY